MRESSAYIAKEAISLPEDERIQLVLKLLESIEGTVSQDSDRVEKAWLEEANRRYQAYLAGEEKAIPAEQVFA